MCDTTPLKLWLLAILAMILLSAGLVLGAAIANLSLFQISNSPWLIGAAGGAALIGSILCGVAISALDAVCTCAGAKCAGECSNLRNNIKAVGVVLGIQAVACLVIVIPSLIFIAGTVPMWVILATLFLQAALIISAIFFIDMLDKCVNAPAPPSSGGPLTGDPTRPGLTTR